MGVSARKLVYDFDRKYSEIISGGSKRIPLVDKIAYLNDFQHILFNNSVKEAERNQESANEIRNFKIDRKSLNLENVDSRVMYAKYPSDFHTRLNQIATIAKPDCCDVKKEIIVRIVQSDDIHVARKNPLQNSSFFFERLIGAVSDKGLILYHDGYMQVEEVLIDYYRKPIELHAPSLEKCDDGGHYYLYNGQIVTTDTECEFENYSDDFISDGAVLLASADKRDPEGFKLKLEKLLQSRNLYTTRD